MMTINDLSADLRRRNPVATVALAERTTLRVGGPAQVVTLEARADLPELVAAGARWLGRGANLVVGDHGVGEPVVVLGAAFRELHIGEPHAGRALVAAGAACDLARLVGLCAKAGLAGTEGLAGVPATVGGALRMNAGTAEIWTFDHVARVEVLLPGEDRPRWLERSEVPAAYRTSGLPPGTVFLGAEFDLAVGDAAALRQRASELKRRKAATQPLAERSAGCTFKNPAPELPAGRLIEELGCKGTRVGDAEVSRVHANFIVNRGAARAADVATLIQRIRHRAWRERGVALELEVETWNCPPDLHRHPSEIGDEEVADG